MSLSGSVFSNESENIAIPLPAFARWENWDDGAVKVDERKFSRDELEQKESLRKNVFAAHQLMINFVAQWGLQHYKTQTSYFPELKPLTPATSALDKALNVLPKKDGKNIFGAIFLDDKTSTPQQKIEFAELLIETYGYFPYVVEILLPENAEILKVLLSDPAYIDFLQRLYIEYLRTQNIEVRDKMTDVEKRILTVLANHYKDGGKRLFHNFTSNNNLSVDALKPFASWRLTLIRNHIASLDLKDFQRQVILFTGEFQWHHNFQLLAQDAEIHKQVLGIFLTDMTSKKFDKLKFYDYLKAYFDQFETYPEVMKAHGDLNWQLGFDFHCGDKFDHAAKKYADLRLLVLAQKNSQDPNADHSIPGETKDFLNPSNRNSRLLSSRSAFHIIGLFASEPQKAAERLKAKEDRVSERFKSECRM